MVACSVPNQNWRSLIRTATRATSRSPSAINSLRDCWWRAEIRACPLTADRFWLSSNMTWEVWWKYANILQRFACTDNGTCAGRDSTRVPCAGKGTIGPVLREAESCDWRHGDGRQPRINFRDD